MTLGIGLYAPCMILISLLGMNPTAAFPIMMGSCAFLMPVGGIQFIRKDELPPARRLGLALGGVPAVLVAAFIVKSLPLLYVRWLVVVVVLYTASSMISAAVQEPRGGGRGEAVGDSVGRGSGLGARGSGRREHAARLYKTRGARMNRAPLSV